ncbi:MAG: diiron oxygenase [Actinomycetota bacterium]|nr:diiron oxygenase [Actinomycetota bacterium]
MPTVNAIRRHPPRSPEQCRRNEERIDRLSRLSAGRGHDAYTDIAWDDPEMALDVGDPRLSLVDFEPITRTGWYRSLSPEEQGTVGAWKIASSLRVGCDFENFLQQALLRRVLARRGGQSEFRYAHHEVIEESQHTLMFNELVQRSGLAATGMPRWQRFVSNLAIGRLATLRPAAFFLLVLTGEEPADRMQRRALAVGVRHPLVERIMRIHVAEEARHVAFAKVRLGQMVPRLTTLDRHLLAMAGPIVLTIGARLMAVPGTDVARGLGVDRRVLLDAYRTPYGRAYLADLVVKPRSTLAELGLSTGPARLLWRLLGSGGEPTAADVALPTQVGPVSGGVEASA